MRGSRRVVVIFLSVLSFYLVLASLPDSDMVLFFDLTITRKSVNLLLTFTTVFPLAVVRYMVKPGVPPNAGFFFQ